MVGLGVGATVRVPRIAVTMARSSAGEAKDLLCDLRDAGGHRAKHGTSEVGAREESAGREGEEVRDALTVIVARDRGLVEQRLNLPTSASRAATRMSSLLRKRE